METRCEVENCGGSVLPVLEKMGLQHLASSGLGTSGSSQLLYFHGFYSPEQGCVDMFLIRFAFGTTPVPFISQQTSSQTSLSPQDHGFGGSGGSVCQMFQLRFRSVVSIWHHRDHIPWPGAAKPSGGQAAKPQPSASSRAKRTAARHWPKSFNSEPNQKPLVALWPSLLQHWN